MTALPRFEYPHTAAVAEDMATYGNGRHYALVLKQFLVGVRTAHH
ncbi:MAG TPA: hypothetical protein VGL99_21200 [Chloroflexota bacterium]